MAGIGERAKSLALRVHGMGTECPHEVWIAIDRKARRPARTPAQVRVVRLSKAMLTYGVVRRPMLGVPVSITSPARTVVDCFRYRNKFGLDTALEALRDALRQRVATVDEIMRAAKRLPGAHGPRTIRRSGFVVTTRPLKNVGASVRGRKPNDDH